MPGPSERVVVDPDRLRALITTMIDVQEVLRTRSRLLVRTLAEAGLPVDPAVRLGSLGDEVETEIAMLRRRLILAEGVDDALPGPGRLGQDSGGEAGGDGVLGVGAGAARRLVARGVPDVFATSEQAQAAGHGLARALRGHGRDSPPTASPRDALTVLRARQDDPDFLRGFHDSLGPGGLARLLYRVAGLPPAPLVRRAAEPLGFDRREAERVLARSLAVYSRQRPLDNAWLGRFNTRGRTDSAETLLFAPLLRAGPLPAGGFDPGLLERLGRLAFGPGEALPDPAPTTASASASAGTREPTGTATPRDVGLLTAGGGPSRPTRASYQVTLLDAIAAAPTLAARFAAQRIVAVLSSASVLSRPWPVTLDDARSTDRAWARLVAAAGSQASRRADPAASADFVTRLAHAVHQTGDLPLPIHLRAAFVPALRTYGDQMYDTVTAVVPGLTPGGADRTASTTRAGDPASAASAPVTVAGTGTTSSSATVRLPAEVWGSLLRECLRGGALAGLLARDVTAYDARLEVQVAESTRGWNTGVGGYPSSPRALGYLRGAQVRAFFAHTLADATESVLRDHAATVAAHRRQQAVLLGVLGEVAKSIDPTNPAGSLAHMGVGVTVEMIEARIRENTRDQSTAQPGRVIEQLRAADAIPPGWAAAYEASARRLWARRDHDPLRPVTVTTLEGPRRVYTGDPRSDGFITAPEEDFLDASGHPRLAARMTPTQRAAYAGWLASPAMVANNDRIPSPGAEDGVASPSALPPDWRRTSD